MSILLIVVVVLVAVVALSHLTWSSLSGEQRSVNRYKRAMDVLGSLPGRQLRLRGETGSRRSDQVGSSVSDQSPPEEAVVGDTAEATWREQDVRRLGAPAAEAGASVEVTSNSAMPRSEDRDRGKDLEVIGKEVTSPTSPRPSPRRVASGLLGYLLMSNKTRPRPRGWAPVLAGALVVLAVSAISGTLVAGLMTSSSKRPAVTSSPTTVPITTPPTTTPPVSTPITTPPTTVPITTPPLRTPTIPAATPTATASKPGPTTAPPTSVPTPPVTPAAVPPPPKTLDRAAHHHPDSGEQSHGGDQGGQGDQGG
jgi:hypothetical protein